LEETVHDEHIEGPLDSWDPNGIQLVASLVEQGAEIPVLVTVPGGLIAGTAISQYKYFTGLRDEYAMRGASKMGAALAALVPPVADEHAETDDHTHHRSLFLRSGRFVIGNAPLGGDGLFIRVRIAAISALALGTLE
jgi:hypothetical protein